MVISTFCRACYFDETFDIWRCCLGKYWTNEWTVYVF